MDTQETANSVTESAPAHGEITVKSSVPLPPQGFQARPQGPPPPSPRNTINNGPVGAPRQPAQLLRRLDSRSSLGPPGAGQFVQLRPYGPPRPPPAGSFPPRLPQPGQFPPQNPPQNSPQNPPLYPPNQRFPYSPGIRGPPPQAAGQRPPFIGNQQQAYQAQQQQLRGNNDPRFQRPDVAPQNGTPPRNADQTAPYRPPGQESAPPRQLLRNDSLLSLQRQRLLSNEEIKQPTRPRIVIERMADINETRADKPEGYSRGKRSDNDDDDDVVMDNERSPRHNGGAPEGLTNGSKSSLTPRRRDEDDKSVSRPGSAVVENKTEEKRDAAVRPISASADDKASKELADRSKPVVPQSRPASAINNDRGREKEDPTGDFKEIKKLGVSHENDAIAGVQHNLKTPARSSDGSRSGTPSRLDMPPNAEQEPKAPDRSRFNASLHLDTPRNAEQEPRAPSKSPDKSRSSTPAVPESPGKAEQEFRTPVKTPDKSRAGISTALEPPHKADSETPSKSTPETPAKKLDKSRSITPTGIEPSNVGAHAESDKSFGNSRRDKFGDDAPRVRESSRPASSLGPPNATIERGSRSPKSPRSPTTPENKLPVPGSPNESVKGFDNGQRRSLSSRSGPVRSPRLTEAAQNGSASESQAVPTTNGVAESPTKKSKEVDKRSTAGSPTKSPSKSAKSLPRTPETPPSTAQEKKKLPMNKVQVGAAPSPNLKTVRSKIGSLDNASYRPGGGKVKIENRKLDFSKAQPKIAAKNEKYTPSGGDKKISQVKLQWNAKSKVGSLDNATYKPGGGDKKIETVKLDFKDKAKPKVGSKDNTKHVPGGGAIKSATSPKTPQETKNDIPMQKLDIKAESKIGSLDNVKHKPGGGDKKIFNDRDYLRQTSSNVESVNGSGSQARTPVEENRRLLNGPKADVEILQPQPPPSTPTKIRHVTAPSSIVTPRAVRSGLAKSPETPTPRRQFAQETESAIFVGKTPSPDAIDGEKVLRSRSPKSPISPRPPSSLNVKSASIPRKTSSNTPRKTPPQELHLPKLSSSPASQEASPAPESHTKVTLPKLIESQSARIAY